MRVMRKSNKKKIDMYSKKWVYEQHIGVRPFG
jgi:hypothetical protein